VDKAAYLVSFNPIFESAVVVQGALLKEFPRLTRGICMYLTDKVIAHRATL